MATDANDAAFSRPMSRDEVNGFSFETFGLTKREYFAATALQGLLATPDQRHEFCGIRDYADTAVRYADALIAELNKATGEQK